MILSTDLRSELNALRQYMRNLKAQRKEYPYCKIMKTTNKGKEVYYRIEYDRNVRTRKALKYGSDDYFDVLKGIVLDAKIEIVEHNGMILKSLADEYRDITPLELVNFVSEKYPKIDRRDITVAVYDLEQLDSEPSDWAKTPYKQADYLEDGRSHTTSRGLKVRSKSELAICEILYANEIEFRYEEVLLIDGEIFIPDFTIRRKSDGKIFYWEHCGMMDDPAYRERHLKKLEAYKAHGIVPWDNLIVTYDNDGNLNLEYIESIVKTVLAI